MKIKKYSGCVIPYYIFSLDKSSAERDIFSVYTNSIIECIPGSVFWKDADGRYLGCNQFVLNMAGLKNIEDILGKTDADLYWGDHANAIRKTDEDVLQSGRTIIQEETIITSDGGEFIALSHKGPLIDSEKNIIGTVGIAINISELKETQEKLKVALDQAQIAARTKDSVIENLRHDWITPFCGMVGVTQAGLDTEKDPERLEYWQMVKDSAECMMAHMKSILALIDAADGRLPLTEKPHNLREISENVYHMFYPEVHRKGLTLELSIDDAPIEVWGDGMRFERILMSLMSNALKFTKEGGITLLVTEGRRDNKKVLVKVVMKDTGIGMTEAQLAEIYQPFFRAHPSHQAVYEGAGVGLSIAKRYIDDMEGQIYCESELGQGSTFTVVLPFRVSLLGPVQGGE